MQVFKANSGMISVCVIFLALSLCGAARGDMTGINLISQTNHVWGSTNGDITSDFYDITSSSFVSGSATGMWSLPQNPEYTSDGGGYSGAGDFGVMATGWSMALPGQSIVNRASSTYVFSVEANLIEVSFDGYAGVYSAPQATFWLRDLTTGVGLDSWDYWTDGPGAGYPTDGFWEFATLYAVVPSHEYELTLYSQTVVGDGVMEASARLNAAISAVPVPIPSACFLGIVGFATLSLLRRWRAS